MSPRTAKVLLTHIKNQGPIPCVHNAVNVRSKMIRRGWLRKLNDKKGQDALFETTEEGKEALRMEGWLT